MTLVERGHERGPEARPAVGATERLCLVLPLAFLGAALGLWLTSLSGIDTDDISDIGLISALPPAFFASIALLTAGFFVELSRRAPRPAVLWAHLGLAVVFLQGVVAVVEGAPRFPTSWIHAGFTDQIADHHTTLPMLDARFSWPGFFSLAALVQTVAGLDTALWFVRWSPVVFGLATLLPAAAIVRVAAVDDRARWTALWLFCVANWVGQDYFSPQALNFFLYLVLVAVLLHFFRPAVEQPVPLLSKVGSLETPVATAAPRTRAALVLVVVGLFAASTMSHQLTPFAMAAAAAALVVARRCTLSMLPILFAAGALAWVSWGAEVYWVGHLSDVTGGIGRVTGSLSSGVANRLSGSSGHLMVLRMRMVATVLLWLVAAVGAWRCYRRTRAVPWPHLLLAVAPFSLVALQSYGGEILLRVYLFALPFVALLAGLAFFPGPGRPPAGDPPGRLGSEPSLGGRPPRWGLPETARVLVGGRLAASAQSAERERHQPPGRRPLVAATALSLAGALAFLVIRYGNEGFESFTKDEVAAVAWVYDNAAPGSRVLALNPSLPWKHRDLEKFSYLSQVAEPHLDEGSELLNYLINQKDRRADGYLVITASQIAHGELVQGFQPGWALDVARLLLATGRVEVAFQNEKAVVLHHAGVRR